MSVALVVIRLDDFRHGHPELVLDKYYLAAGNQPIVDVDVDRLPDLAVEFEHRAGSELEQVADFHVCAAQHGRNLNWNVEHGFEVGCAAIDGLAIGGRERPRVLHDLHVAAVFEVWKRYLCVVVTHCRLLQKSYAAGALRAAI